MASGSAAKCVAQSADIQGADNFPQGCSFSPDGLCILTSTTDDSLLRLYNTPQLGAPAAVDDCSIEQGDLLQASSLPTHEWKAVLSMQGGDTVRSCSWYPSMKSTDPSSCCFLAAARDQPVHLYDAYSGIVRASYRPFNALDEMESPAVVEFSDDGQKILCGGFRTDRTIHLFDTSIPGRDSTLLRLGKTRRSSDGQKGLVSAACFGGKAGGPGKHVVAIGTYSPGSIYIYDFRAGQQASGTIMSGLCVVGHGKGHSRKKQRFDDGIVRTGDANLNGDDDDATDDMNWFSSAKIKWFQSRAQGGVTQLSFGRNDEYILYSASRRANAVIAWDLRMLSGNPEHQSCPVRGMASYETLSDTNQRLEFEIDETGEFLFTGGQDGCVRVYILKSGELRAKIDRLGDVANGVSHSWVNGRSLLAITTGSRRFDELEDGDAAALPPDSENFSSLRLFEPEPLAESHGS